MSKVSDFLKEHTGVAIVTLAAVLVLSIGFAVSLTIFLATLFGEKLYDFDFCLTSSCVKFWTKKNEAVFDILFSTGNIIAVLITLGGIVVALFSYLNSVQSSKLANHLAQLTIFTEYIRCEIEKRPRITNSDVDVLKWYNILFKNSSSGSFDVSDEYQALLQQINSNIDLSNHRYENVDAHRYEYKHHQKTMIDIFDNFGIKMSRLPRIDFNEAESQVLDLISTANRSFCRSLESFVFKERRYH
ncbi:retron Ec48 family effector membrane protein [Stutzerimonas stutzeri]|uniref:retron Ec48 family effector membrane protein n=1 Tax=Stutzerimonas stutzeri TaxID=316 RepID=UPI001C2EF429|nr:retron Ec48 family effector membrane protein [Stutzerimonas stutzeri]